MKTVDITPEAMEKHIARASKLERIENEYSRREGVPPEALRMIAADRIHTIVSEGAAPGAAVGSGGISVYLLDCPPEDALRDVYYPPDVGAQLVERFGPEAKAGIERMGLQFTAEQGARDD